MSWDFGMGGPTDGEWHAAGEDVKVKPWTHRLAFECPSKLKVEDNAGASETRTVTGNYTMQEGMVNDLPTWSNEDKSKSIWYFGLVRGGWYYGGWIVGDTSEVGDDRGYLLSTDFTACPSDVTKWKYVDDDDVWITDTDGKV